MNRFLIVRTLLVLCMLSSLALAAFADESERLSKLTTDELSRIISDKEQIKTTRWYATIALARKKDPATKPLLITLLSDDYHAVRVACVLGALPNWRKGRTRCVVGLLAATSIESEELGDLGRATEAQKELPDKRVPRSID